MHNGGLIFFIGLVLSVGAMGPTFADEKTFANEKWSPEELEFFESRIRPVLVDNCYECHNSTDVAEGGLAVDYRQGLLEGGAEGDLIVPGKPEESRLLAILRHEVDGMEMPQGGPQLKPAVLADVEKWIAMGAPDPRRSPPTADEVEAATSWEALFERRQEWWSFQPIKNPEPPTVDDPRWNDHPIDRFLQSKREDVGIEPAEPADPAILVRRLYINLIGLPPESQEATKWTARLTATEPAQRDAVVEALVDDLLARPQFGERWARHWMDWTRYAESHGSEGDPAIDNAWQYRDYLIRALNADIGYDQLLREHVAGDLLDEPRISEELGINESNIGPAHWRMVFHGFAPTDALDEKVRFTDDQINTFSKAFLGLTVSCARCHNHKFDAISQADYYALFGVLGSCRPARKVIDAPERVNRNRGALEALKPKIRTAIADDWLNGLPRLGEQLSAEGGRWQEAENESENEKFLLHPLAQIREKLATGESFEAAWQDQVRIFQETQAEQEKWRSRAGLMNIEPTALAAGPDATVEGQIRPEASAYGSQSSQASSAVSESTLRRWDLSQGDAYAEWFPSGAGVPERPQAAGEFSVASIGDVALTGIYPAGVYSHHLSSKHAARLTSPDLLLEQESDLWVRVLGDGEASLRYVVQDYPRSGTVYPVVKLTNEWRWQRFDLSYWTGDTVHVELAAAKDAPLLVSDQPRSWFGVRQAMVLPKGQPGPADPVEHLQPILDAAAAASPDSWESLVGIYEAAIADAITAWRTEQLSDGQAALLDACIRQGLLPNKLDALPSAEPLLREYRRLEDEIPVPTRVVGLDESVGRDQALLIRGDHKTPGETVPRRFLEAIDPTPYDSRLSGRRELAEDLLRDDNPFTRRVVVNRLWHHLFGQGIVATPDNFGRLGAEPTHPELLDWLANRFVEDGWSIKQLVRLIVTSKTWQLSSRPSLRAQRIDPENRWLSHAHVRRLEAEAIRDTMLSVSGLLDDRLFGSPVAGDALRRSVYVQVVRNSLDPFLRVFDFPEPFSTVGRRDVTNVPAQSLTIMNDERVLRYASAWADQLIKNPALSNRQERISEMFLTAFGRIPTADEFNRLEQYLDQTERSLENRQQQAAALQTQLGDCRDEIEGLIGPVRERLETERQAAPTDSVEDRPRPIARWDFDADAKDQIGSAHSRLVGSARLEDGALVVGGDGYAISEALGHTLAEKTLEAWVQLDNIDQRGGGVITVQTPSGNEFDSIVFGEQDPGQWLAGSNNFKRTQSFAGPPESIAATAPVHIAIVYQSDGRIEAYRNGNAYGTSYSSSGPLKYRADAVVTFGLRHLPAGGNRLLAGRIYEAGLYDRALTADEIKTASQAGPATVSEQDVMAELSKEQQSRIEALRRKAEGLEQEVAALGVVPAKADETLLWAELARVFFMLKEFIYVR